MVGSLIRYLPVLTWISIACCFRLGTGSKSTRHVIFTVKRFELFTVQSSDKWVTQMATFRISSETITITVLVFLVGFSLPSYTNASERESRARVMLTVAWPNKLSPWLILSILNLQYRNIGAATIDLRNATRLGKHVALETGDAGNQCGTTVGLCSGTSSLCL